jgi:hypothetical protein
MIELNDPPHLRTFRLRKKLFLPHLDRLLGDPGEFSLDDSTDSVRVRLDQAVSSIEKKSRELAEEAHGIMNRHRFGVMICALVGAALLIIGLSAQYFLVPCILVAGLEAAFMIWFSQNRKRYTYDTLELQELSERYRPVLVSCATLDDLRKFSEQVREEMDAVCIDPREDLEPPPGSSPQTSDL